MWGVVVSYFVISLVIFVWFKVCFLVFVRALVVYLIGFDGCGLLCCGCVFWFILYTFCLGLLP